jgi:glucoamylase
MEAFAGESGLLPEQIWDAPDVPERGLFLGRPSGSAMPLAWTHAEYLKLRRSLRDGRVFDQPVRPALRYRHERPQSACAVWRFNLKCRTVPVGKVLRVETLAPAVVHWSAGGWHSVHDTATRDVGLGVHIADLPTAALPGGVGVQFTFYWPDANRWEGRDFNVEFAGEPSWSPAEGSNAYEYVTHGRADHSGF